MRCREWKSLVAVLAGAWLALPATLEAQTPGSVRAASSPPALLNAPDAGQASPLVPDSDALPGPIEPAAPKPVEARKQPPAKSHRRLQPAQLDNSTSTGAPLQSVPARVAQRPATPPVDAAAEPELEPQREGAAGQGRWTQWENGRAMWTCEFRDGKRHGKGTRYFVEGEGSLLAESRATQFSAPFQAIAFFKDGHLDGTCTIIDSKKRKLCELALAHDELEGEAVWYYPSGQPREVAHYHVGRLQGKRLEYSDDGQLVKEDDYLDGRITTTQIEYYPSKRKLMRGNHYLAGSQLYAHFDWLRGDLVTSVVRNYPTDVRTGVWVWWHEDGQRQLEGRYEEDQPIGTFTWWHPNGQKERQGDYVDGLQSGQWTWWFPNGQKQMQGTYAAGEASQAWQFWREDGTPVQGAKLQVASPSPPVNRRARVTSQQPYTRPVR